MILPAPKRRLSVLIALTLTLAGTGVLPGVPVVLIRVRPLAGLIALTGVLVPLPLRALSIALIPLLLPRIPLLALVPIRVSHGRSLVRHRGLTDAA